MKEMRETFQKLREGGLELKDTLKITSNKVYFLGIEGTAFPTKEYGTGLIKLKEKFGDGILQGFKEGSRKGGRELANHLKIENLEEAKFFIETLGRLGYGKIIEFKEESEKIIIRIKDSWTSRALKYNNYTTKFPTCYIELGLFQGILEGALKKEVESEEVKCQAKGDEYCEFLFELKGET